MNLRRSGCFFPPQALLTAPQPCFQNAEREVFCMPYTQYEVTGQKIYYHSFFLALKLPAWPEVLQIESLHIWAADQAKAFGEVLKEIGGLAGETDCSSLLVRVIDSTGSPLYFPTSGFWTSPSNPASLMPLLQQAGLRESACSSVWELPCKEHPTEAVDWFEMLPTFPSVGSICHWNQCVFQIALQSAQKHTLYTFRLIPNLAPEIAAYGKLPPRISWRLFPQVRLHLAGDWPVGANAVFTQLTGFLARQGIKQCQIGNVPLERQDLQTALITAGGHRVAWIREYMIPL